MIFPRGEARHQNLLTAYTDLSALVSSLKGEGFSGTIEIEFPGTRGILFMASGDIISAEVWKSAGSKRMIGQEAARYLLSLANQKDGVLNVYRMPPERITAVASNLQSEVVYKDLASDFTRLDRLILKLREEKHNGFIEIFTKEQKGMGVLFFQEGEVVDLLMTSESGGSVMDKKSIPIFLENVVKQGVIFNVHRSQARAPIKETPPVKEAPPMKETPPIREMSPSKDGGSTRELLSILQEILSKVEKSVDKASGNGTFIRVFKRSLIEKSAEYPFLDPFAGELEYRDGVLVFKGETGIREFAKSVGECMRLTLVRLEEELPKKKLLSLNLKAQIESVLEHHREGMKRLGVEPILASLVQ